MWSALLAASGENFSVSLAQWRSKNIKYASFECLYATRVKTCYGCKASGKFHDDWSEPSDEGGLIGGYSGANAI